MKDHPAEAEGPEVKTAQKTVQTIAALVARQPDITRQQLAQAIGLTESGVKCQLKKMQEKGLIRRVGPDKGGHWQVLK
ncbi:MAG: winged helix-turn-helix transcriptional regulator [Deltaproteobacteria bacterium]|nr:winged helix-turn-helix transcriptional regulator [Deltaproteobacteria bacterium]